MSINSILRLIFYWPIRLTTTCQSIPYEPLKTFKINKKKPIVYVLLSSSVGNLLTVERITKKLHWPSPFEPIKYGNKKIPRIAYLRKPAFFSQNATPVDVAKTLHLWLECSESMELDFQVIPITVLWSRNPSYEGKAIIGVDAPTPSIKKFLTLTFAGRDNCTIFSDPLSLQGLMKKLAGRNRPDFINRAFALQFLRKARGVVGAPLPNRKKLIQELLQSDGVKRAISEQQTKTGESAQALYQRAEQIYQVMVADTRYPLIRFLNAIISFLWHRFYHGQAIIGASRVRYLAQNGYEIIYIPCHRSHMDYVLLSFVLFHEGLPLPQIASGDNLNFFPVGPIIRRCGSYFIRRKMKGDKFYTALFREYLHILFQRGYATEFFIEGGRSRSGRTLPPRTGMVSMTVQAQLRGVKRPIAFVPTYLGYEHVMEVGSYMKEMHGDVKKKESAAALLGIFKRLRYYGRGYVTFGQPIIVPKFLSKHVENWQDDIDPTGRNKPAWLYNTVESLASEIIMKLNDSASANGINLCAMAILSDDDQCVSINVLRQAVTLFLQVLKVDPNRHKSIPQASVELLIKQALELNKFKLYDVGDLQYVRASVGQTIQLTYFQNNILHLFALPSLIANIILRNGHILKSDIITHTRSLFYFLRHELFVPVSDNDLDNLIIAYIELFTKEGYVTQSNDTIYLSGDGYAQFNILSRAIRLNLIRYLIATTALRLIENNSINLDEYIDKCMLLAKKLPQRVTNKAPEFADPIMFKIIAQTLLRHEYIILSEDGLINKNEAKVHKLASVTAPLLGASDVKILNSQNF